MKKHLIYILTILYIASLFLPFAYTMSIESYQLEPFSGWEFLMSHPLLTGLFILVTLLLLFGQKLSLTWKTRLETALVLLSAYLYSIPFQNDTTINISDMVNRILTVLKTGLASGYYVSLVILIALIICLHLSSKHKTSH